MVSKDSDSLIKMAQYISLLNPRANTNTEILFHQIWKISETYFTQEMYDDEVKWERYKKETYEQFDFVGVFVPGMDPCIRITHPTQIKNPFPLGSCLCSKAGIKLHCVVRNKVSQETCWVGSSCIKNFLKHLTPQLKLAKTIYKNRERGNICHYCYDPLIDLRLQYQRDGFCNRSCHRKYDYIMPIGKHKGINFLEFIVTKRGQRWVKWINDERAKDSDAFRRYPLMLEIMEEVSIED